MRTSPSGQTHQFPLANLTPMGSSFPMKEPRSVSIARFGCRVIWDPTAALPLLCIKRRRFPICAPPPSPRAKPVTPAPLRPQGVTLQPLSSPTPSLSRWQLSSGKRASRGVNGTLWGQSYQDSYSGGAADALDLDLGLDLIRRRLADGSAAG